MEEGRLSCLVIRAGENGGRFHKKSIKSINKYIMHTIVSET